MNSLHDWHHRFVQQARWTKNLRDYLFRSIKLENARSVLDVGCGTGALAKELAAYGGAAIFGLDINLPNLLFARDYSNASNLTGGDAHFLPYPQNTFDIVLCHFLLLWVSDPRRVLREMRRVARDGGFVIAIAEPDYGGRIDFPDELYQAGQIQIEALQRQGANPLVGRQLTSLFSQNGFSEIETGVLGAQWKYPIAEEEWQVEWRVLEADIENLIPADRLQKLKKIDEQAWETGNRLLYVPTFYTLGKKGL